MTNIAVTALVVLILAQAAGQPLPEQPAFARFDRLLENYMSVWQEAGEAPLAREGHLFPPDVAAAFRGRISHTLAEHGVDPADLLAEMNDDVQPGARPPEVNHAFSWANGNMMPPCLIEALPALPRDIQYRLVGRDLVVLDTRTSLIIDILRNGLLVTTTEHGRA